MQDFSGTLIGKFVGLALLFRKSGGQALPGLIVERLLPGYVPRMLAKLPEGAVIITGTNGKTTTTKIVTHILQSGGKRVLTNPTGSNLIRGIASSLARQADWLGRLSYDIAVLEVDEATARRLANLAKPRWVLTLNVSRDQLDRFGEVDTIASYVGAAMEQATDGIVTNCRDPHLLHLVNKGQKIPAYYFGTADKLSKYFPNDYELASVDKTTVGLSNTVKADVELSAFSGQKVTYKIDGKSYEAELKLSGQHNFLNGAAALALCRCLLPNIAPAKLLKALSEVELAFGRGEKYRLPGGAEIELVLVKNPASFTQALASYAGQPANLMIAINDNIADGRDISWLWDVNFAPLSGRKVTITSGTRAADMALRLSYDDISTGQIERSLPKAVKILSRQDGRKVVLATYTAMLKLYKLMSRTGEKVL